MSPSVSIIPQSLLLNGLSGTELRYVLSHGMERQFKRKTTLISQGDQPKAIYLILEGRVKVCRCSKEGEEVVTRLLGPGDSLLENVVFYGKSSPVSAQTETDTHLLVLPADVALSLVQKMPAFALNMMQILATRTNEMMYLLEQVTLHPATDRVAGFLLRVMLESGEDSSSFRIPYEKALIARHLGLTQATLSRCFKELEGRGIHVKGRNVTLDDRFSLCQFGDPIYAHKCKNCGTPVCHLSRH